MYVYKTEKRKDIDQTLKEKRRFILTCTVYKYFTFSSFIYFLLQLDAKQLFSKPIVIVESLENITNFLTLLKRFVVQY